MEGGLGSGKVAWTGGGSGTDPDKVEWLDAGETELKVRAVFKTEPGKDGKPTVDRFEYHPETVANIVELRNQRTRKLIVYYCGNFNRQLERFARDHGPVLCKQQHDAAAAATTTPADAYSVADAIYKVVMEKGGQDAKDASNACAGMNDPKKIKREHAPLFLLGCVAQYLTEHGKDVSLVLPLAVAVAYEDLREIMRCPQEMVHLADRQLEIEYQHDGLQQAVAAGAIPFKDAEDFMKANPVPSRAQFRLMEREKQMKGDREL